MSSVARVTEIIASSKKSFEDAVDNGVKRATKTLKNVAGAWVASQELVIAKGRVTEYRVRLKVTFVLSDGPERSPTASPADHCRGSRNRSP